MIYLLYDEEDNSYLVVERIGNIENVFYNTSCPSTPPTIFEDGVEYKVDVDTSGNIINWWNSKYTDSLDGKLITKHKTRENYIKWINKHPEYLI